MKTFESSFYSSGHDLINKPTRVAKRAHAIRDGLVYIPLTRGKVAVVDICDVELANFNWSGNYKNGHWYAARSVVTGPRNTRMITMHRVVASRAGVLVDDLMIDHIDGNGLNNVRSNLRTASALENAQNKKRNKRNTSGSKGVYWDKRRCKWRSVLSTNGKRIFIGAFDTISEAAVAYAAAARRHHGAFARLA